MAATIATMKAAVATNKWYFALTTKNTSSGPSSVASLNSGCGWVLSILVLNPRDRFRKIARRERCEILDTFADADEMHRQLVLFGERDQDSAARGSVELGHHEPGDAS